MKMRIKGNSIRMRLTQSEIRKIGDGNSVSETLSFGGGVELVYSLVPTSEARTLRAEFDRREIRVLVPLTAAQDWAKSDQISMKQGESNIQDRLFILVEKDFLCLKPRQHEVEDESDLYPNPNKAHGQCGVVQ